MGEKEKSRFEIIAEQVGKVVTEKNKAYGNSFEESQQFLKILYPNGVPVESYGDMLCIIRIFDKLKRIATRKDAFLEDPFEDLCGYSILGIDINNKRKASLNTLEESQLLEDVKINNNLKSQSGGISNIKHKTARPKKK